VWPARLDELFFGRAEGKSFGTNEGAVPTMPKCWHDYKTLVKGDLSILWGQGPNF